jgi:arylamine N-acetyltransferase
MRLGPGVSRTEAMRVADVAVHYSEQLAESYDMVKPVELHNVMVNLGMRKGGLCYEYAECMLAELRELPVRTMEFRRAIAWKDDLWNEHNSVVAVAPGQPFETGVILDAWRNGGRLRWAPVRLDHYPWQPKPPPASEMVVTSPRGQFAGGTETARATSPAKLPQ